MEVLIVGFYFLLCRRKAETVGLWNVMTELRRKARTIADVECVVSWLCGDWSYVEVSVSGCALLSSNCERR